MSDFFTEKEIRFIEDIRAEASELKDCYTKFSFQSWIFASASIGIIARLQAEYPWVGFAALLPLIVLLSVARIGIHKYTGANRIYGFELYMNRRRRLEQGSEITSHRTIGWEEAYYAWRIVQASLYSIHHPDRRSHFGFISVPRTINHEGDVETTKSIFERRQWTDHVKMYPGSYLAVNFSVTFAFCAACLLVVGVSMAMIVWDQSYEVKVIAVFAFILMALLLYKRALKLSWRRYCLEHGIVSINSCAVIWNVTVHAHFRTIDRLKNGSASLASFQGYTDELTTVTEDIVRNYRARGLPALYDWLGEQGTEGHSSSF